LLPKFTTPNTGISTSPASLAGGVWGQDAQNVNFNVAGAKSYTLGGVGVAAIKLDWG